MSEAKELNVFKIDDGETHWYSAPDEDSVLKMHIEQFGYGSIEEFKEENCFVEDEDVAISQVDDSTIIKVHDIDDNIIIPKTARQWADEGEGLIASSVY